jgi:RNA polymerase sigma-70 factor (ECF subfamily)
MASSDEQLAQRLQNGDRSAMSALVERHYEALMGYLYRMTRGDRALAEDLAQEAFLRALRGIGGYQQTRPFKPWLYAIATNIARNYYTSADQRRTASVDDDAEYGEDDAPDSALLEADEAREVIAALDTLPSHQREVIVLYFYEALSLQAVAEALEIPLGTVKSRLSLGVKRLRERMETDDVSQR